MQSKIHFFGAGLTEDEFYIIKQKRGNKELTPAEAVHDHLAHSIYRLFGIQTPDLFIGEYHGALSLISRVLPGYRDLAEWLNNERALDEINSQADSKSCIARYQKFEAGLSFTQKEQLLAAAIFLGDVDVVGSGFRNLGLIESAGKHHLVKIDPSEAIFDVLPEYFNASLQEFKDSLSLDNPFIHDDFSCQFVSNNPRSVLGNLHLMEFFHDINKDKLILELAKFAQLDDDWISVFVMRQEYMDLLPMKNKALYLDYLLQILIGRKEVLKTFCNMPEALGRIPVLPQIHAGDMQWSEPIELISHGASKPFKVKKIAQLRLESESYGIELS